MVVVGGMKDGRRSEQHLIVSYRIRLLPLPSEEEPNGLIYSPKFINLLGFFFKHQPAGLAYNERGSDLFFPTYLNTFPKDEP